MCRLYRGDMAASDDPGLHFIACGGEATVTDVCAYEMGTIWKHAEDQPIKAHEPATE
jgi:hypothetical protein